MVSKAALGYNNFNHFENLERLRVMRMDFNFLTGRKNTELVEHEGLLVHREALKPFKNLQLKARQEIGANLQILSSFRHYSRQEKIWNDKASGRRALLDSSGSLLDYSLLNRKEVLFSILRWSAIPGVSRHHWGCDFDIFDANKIKKENVQLVPSESLTGGPMYELHKWIDEKIKTDQAFSFFKPYAEDFGGVNTESWHISYAPITELVLEHYTFDIFLKNIVSSSIKLKDLILEDAENIFNLYLKTISKH